MNGTTVETKKAAQRGQTMAEYAVVLGVITVSIVVAFSLLSGVIETAIERTVDLVRSVT